MDRALGSRRVCAIPSRGSQRSWMDWAPGNRNARLSWKDRASRSRRVCAIQPDVRNERIVSILAHVVL
jgi:hypothetical protein